MPETTVRTTPLLLGLITASTRNVPTDGPACKGNSARECNGGETLKLRPRKSPKHAQEEPKRYLAAEGEDMV